MAFYSTSHSQKLGYFCLKNSKLSDAPLTLSLLTYSSNSVAQILLHKNQRLKEFFVRKSLNTRLGRLTAGSYLRHVPMLSGYIFYEAIWTKYLSRLFITSI